MLYQALSERTRECSSLRLVEVLGVLLVEVGHVFEVLLWIVSNMRWDFNALWRECLWDVVLVKLTFSLFILLVLALLIQVLYSYTRLFGYHSLLSYCNFIKLAHPWAHIIVKNFALVHFHFSLRFLSSPLSVILRRWNISFWIFALFYFILLNGGLLLLKSGLVIIRLLLDPGLLTHIFQFPWLILILRMHRALLEYFVIVIIVIYFLISLERPVDRKSSVQSMLDANLHEVNHIFAFVVSYVSLPELLTHTFVNVIVVSFMFVEHVFVWLNSEFVLEIMHWWSGHVVLLLITLFRINLFPLPTHCWVPWMHALLELIWVNVFFFIWCFLDLIHVRHWRSFWFLTFFVLISHSFLLLVFL